ncbi:MAG: type II secretion system protein [bacterium]|nr:type II secretion system protein [bacterium]
MLENNRQHKKTKQGFLCYHSDNQGFTLIEVLIVIAVMAILCAVFISQTSFFQPQAKLASVARDLITDIRYAQQLAVNEQVEYGISFLVSENKYQLWRFSAVPEQIFEKILPQEVQISQVLDLTDDKVKFNAYGAVAEAGSVYLINSESETKIIEIRPSGFAKLHE